MSGLVSLSVILMLTLYLVNVSEAGQTLETIPCTTSLDCGLYNTVIICKRDNFCAPYQLTRINCTLDSDCKTKMSGTIITDQLEEGEKPSVKCEGNTCRCARDHAISTTDHSKCLRITDLLPSGVKPVIKEYNFIENYAHVSIATFIGFVIGLSVGACTIACIKCIRRKASGTQQGTYNVQNTQ